MQGGLLWARLPGSLLSITLILLWCFPSGTAWPAPPVIPLEKLDDWQSEKANEVIQGYALSREVGPVYIQVDKALYEFLLERLEVAAAIARNLGLAKYRIRRLAQGFFYGDDGEGARGYIELLYADATSRIYFSQGRYESKLLPAVTGAALVIFSLNPQTPEQDQEGLQIKFQAYLKIDQRLLALLAKALRPFLGNVVDRKITKLFLVAGRASERLHHAPQSVYQQLNERRDLDAQTLELLKRHLFRRRPNPG